MVRSINKGVLAVTIFCVIALYLPISAKSELLFLTSNNCSFCHSSDYDALVDSKGNDLSIFHDWESTMMANAFRDPLFRAKLESERLRNQNIAEIIEDKCTTCHTPMARTQALLDGSVLYSLAAAETSDLAHDGVSCTLCHQIQDNKLGNLENFTGRYAIDGRREIYGPYKGVFPTPMLNHVNYLPVYGKQIKESALCATCHTLFTPYLDDAGNVAGEFPEQTPYLEWLNSIYASETHAQSCQDCHMPRIDEPIKITRRPPWFQERRSPFWRHHFTGGNTLMLTMMKANTESIGTTAAAVQFQKTIQRTEKRLANEAAEISVAVAERSQQRIRLKVAVENNTGHKFPSGFPSRRAWVRIQVKDNKADILFDSGHWNKNGEITAAAIGFKPHYDTITSSDQVQIYEAIMGDVNDHVTYTLLRAAKYLKDNRLVPKGYLASGPMSQYTAIAGKVTIDENFNKEAGQEGTGIDIITYDIPLAHAQFPLIIKSQLLYQTASPRFIDDLIGDTTPATSQFAKMYAKMEKKPVIIDSSTFRIE
ncbi:MAG: hypothetical protein HKP41_16125 [Desulfobacterales bacterium]|nr:hypothetical protein [Desulfobacterales bacterium]